MRTLTRNLLPALALAATLAHAQVAEKGLWRAASQNAAEITGDISFSNTKLNIGFNGFPLEPVRPIKPAEVAAVFDVAVDTAGNGQLYRLDVPATLRTLGRNTLCGTEATSWMATYLDGKVLKIAFFSGDEPPIITFDALQNSRTLCGTFTYVR